jgi:hypothetical protein
MHIETNNFGDIEYIMQPLVISDDDEMEMTENDDESENQREFRDMGDGNSVNHDDVTDSDSNFG